MNWFEDTYVGMNGTAVVVHSGKISHREAFAPKGTVVL